MAQREEAPLDYHRQRLCPLPHGSASYSGGNPPDAAFTSASCRRWNGFPTRKGPACWWSCATRRRALGRDRSVGELGVVRGRKTKCAPIGLWVFTAGSPALGERSHQQPRGGPPVFPLCSRGQDRPACAPRTPDATPIPALIGRRPAKATFSAAAPMLRRRKSRSKRFFRGSGTGPRLAVPLRQPRPAQRAWGRNLTQPPVRDLSEAHPCRHHDTDACPSLHL